MTTRNLVDNEGNFDPASIEVFVGVDMAKGDHHAQAITSGGEELFDRPVANDEAAIARLISDVDLATDANRITNRARDALVAISPALERAVGERLGHAGVRDLLVRYPTPTALRAAGRNRIQGRLAKRSPRLARTVTDAVVDALAAQTLTRPAEDTWGEVIIDLVGDLERVHTRRAELAKQIEEVFLQHPLAKVLTSLRGFGPRTGARNPRRDRRPLSLRQRWSPRGLRRTRPGRHRSGRSINSATRARGGNHRLKNALFIAAFAAARHDPHARAYYQRKRTEGTDHNAAIVCLARRRCDLILAMLKTAIPYDPTRHENPPAAA